MIPFIVLVRVLLLAIFVKLDGHVIIAVYLIFRYRLLDLVLMSQRLELF